MADKKLVRARIAAFETHEAALRARMKAALKKVSVMVDDPGKSPASIAMAAISVATCAESLVAVGAVLTELRALES